MATELARRAEGSPENTYLLRNTPDVKYLDFYLPLVLQKKGFPITIQKGAIDPDGKFDNPDAFYAITTSGPALVGKIHQIEAASYVNPGVRYVDYALRGDIENFFELAKNLAESEPDEAIKEAEKLLLWKEDIFGLYILAYDRKYREDNVRGLHLGDVDDVRHRFIYNKLKGNFYIPSMDDERISVIVGAAVENVLRALPALDVRTPQG